MRLPRLGLRDRRALLMASALLIPVLGYTQVVRPFASSLGTRQEQLGVERQLLERELFLLAESEDFPNRAAMASSDLEDRAAWLLSGADALSAAGELVQHIAVSARDNRVQIERTEALAEEPAAGALLAVGIELRGFSDLEGLLGFIHALEVGPYLLSIRSLTIERSNRYTRSGTDEEVLGFLATVVGYSIAAEYAVPDRAEPIQAVSTAGAP